MSAQNLINIFIAPGQTMLQLKQSGAHGLLLLGQIAVYAAAMYLFFHGMSPEWIVEQQLLAVGDLSPAELEQARAQMGQMAGNTALISALMAPVGLLFATALSAGYLHLVGKMAGEFSYKDWFGASVWCQMPAMLNMLGLVLIVLLSDTANLPLATVNFASINQLLLGLTPASAYYTLLESLSLFVFWQIMLTAVTLQQWCQFKAGKAYLFAALPYLVVYGVWALLV